MGIGDFVSSQINEGIGAYLRKANIDPLEIMFKGTQPLGTVDVLGTPVTATFDYSVGELTGLSSLTVKPGIHLGSIEWAKLIEGKHPPIEGSFSASGEFKSIAAKLHGGLKASFGASSPEVDLDGALSIEGLGATLDGTLTVTGEGSLTEGIKVCVTAVDIKKLGLTHEAVHLEFKQELGEFGHLLDHAVGAVDRHVTSVIEKGLDSVLESAANAGIKHLLPFCREFHPADVVKEAGEGLLKKLGDWFS